MQLTTTFRLLRKASACSLRYTFLRQALSREEYGDDTPINLLTILETNGLDDALWALCATAENCDKIARLMAADFAEQVLPIWQKYSEDKRPELAIKAARDFANGIITSEEWAAARAAARAAAGDAARAAARDAARAAARDAARAAARDAEGAAAGAAAWAAWAAAQAVAWDAARAAARDAAGNAARAAARAAAWAVKGAAAGDAAWDAARAAERAAARAVEGAAAGDAAWAARAAERAAAREKQKEIFISYLQAEI